MLVLTRKAGEHIVVGRGTEHEVTIVIKQVKNKRAIIGIVASRDAKILRGELKEAE